MSQVSPFTSSVIQTSQVQRQQSAEKDRQARRVADQAKNAALAHDQLEHQVESSEELTPLTEEQKRERRFKKPPHRQYKPDDPAEDEPHLDIQA